ncbi:hypothetical protein B0H15DRAFT_943561 [Mycena belliarum]|uniref:Uncharacterized protein n=1 Tax=Mycena belliarum TaxID=1033014 RepID=A0AAD6UJQ2_9AGAR|nr:hypothetical protein B0H15DRAFT_943561 [Mycena belliae]
MDPNRLAQRRRTGLDRMKVKVLAPRRSSTAATGVGQQRLRSKYQLPRLLLLYPQRARRQRQALHRQRLRCAAKLRKKAAPTVDEMIAGVEHSWDRLVGVIKEWTDSRARGERSPTTSESSEGQRERDLNWQRVVELCMKDCRESDRKDWLRDIADQESRQTPTYAAPLLGTYDPNWNAVMLARRERYVAARERKRVAEAAAEGARLKGYVDL